MSMEIAERREEVVGDDVAVRWAESPTMSVMHSSDSIAERITAAGALLETSRVVTELLRHTAPATHQRSERITRLVNAAVRHLQLDEAWEFEVAARFSQIGRLALPEPMREAAASDTALSEHDERQLASHPLIARDLLADVPRLEAVREMIARQNEPFTVADLPLGSRGARDRTSVGGQLLRVASDFDALAVRGIPPADAVATLAARRGEYDETVLNAVSAVVTVRPQHWSPPPLPLVQG